MTEPTATPEPTNHLGRLADAMFDVLKRYEEPHIQAVVMLVDPDANDGLVAHHGYADNGDALADALRHVQHLGHVAGYQLIIGHLGTPPGVPDAD